MLQETHRSQDGRYSIGFEPPTIFLFDMTDPRQGAVMTWPYSHAGYNDAIQYVTNLAGPLVAMVPPGAPAPPPHGTYWPPRPQQGIWTAWFIAPILLACVGAYLWLVESDNTTVCNSGTGVIGRSLDSGFNNRCTADVLLHNGGIGLFIVSVLWIGLLLILRRPR